MTAQTAGYKQTDSKTQTAALIVSMISALVNSSMGASLNVALPALGREFSMGAVMLGWVAQSMLLSAAVFVVPAGRLADIYGRKKFLLAGSAIYAVSSVLSALSVNAAMLVSSRIVQGVGAAMIAGTGVAILTSVFPQEKRGWAIGWNVSAVYFGLAAGPFLGGIMTHSWGWRSIFWLNAALGAAAVVFIIAMLGGEWADAKGEKLDYAGSVLLGLMIISVIYGLSRMPSLAGAGFAAAGALLLFIFIMFERGRPDAVINLGLFRANPVFAFSNLATFINYSAAFSVGFLVSLYLQYIAGFSPRQAGMVLMAQPVIMFVFSPVTGRLSDRAEPGMIASAGMAVTAAGLFMLCFLGANTPVYYVIISLIVVGSGYALFSSPNTNAIMSAVDRKYYGTASGIISTMRQGGMMTGLAIATMMFSIFTGNARVTPAMHPAFILSVRWAFIISTILCVLGVFASLARGRRN